MGKKPRPESKSGRRERAFLNFDHIEITRMIYATKKSKIKFFLHPNCKIFVSIVFYGQKSIDRKKNRVRKASLDAENERFKILIKTEAVDCAPLKSMYFWPILF